MKTLIAGAVAAIIGIVLLVIWFADFLILLKGAIPIMLLLGGALAVYLGFDEVKDSLKEEATEDAVTESGDKVGEYEKEINSLKDEIQTLKEDKSDDSPESGEEKSG